MSMSALCGVHNLSLYICVLAHYITQPYDNSHVWKRTWVFPAAPFPAAPATRRRIQIIFMRVFVCGYVYVCITLPVGQWSSCGWGWRGGGAIPTAAGSQLSCQP